jgi:hypothetical protein
VPEEFRRGMDGLESRPESRNNRRQPCGRSNDPRLRGSGPPASVLGYCWSQVHRASVGRCASLGKRWSGAKISSREGGRNGHSILLHGLNGRPCSPLSERGAKQKAAALRGKRQRTEAHPHGPGPVRLSPCALYTVNQRPSAPARADMRGQALEGICKSDLRQPRYYRPHSRHPREKRSPVFRGGGDRAAAWRRAGFPLARG